MDEHVSRFFFGSAYRNHQAYRQEWYTPDHQEWAKSRQVCLTGEEGSDGIDKVQLKVEWVHRGEPPYRDLV